MEIYGSTIPFKGQVTSTVYANIKPSKTKGSTPHQVVEASGANDVIVCKSKEPQGFA